MKLKFGYDLNVGFSYIGECVRFFMGFDWCKQKTIEKEKENDDGVM
jgi:hypothetical protein